MQTLLDLLACVFQLIYNMAEAIVLFFVPRSYRYKSVEGDIILVTGGGSGIGRLLAFKFAKHGAKIVVWDVNEEGAQETVRIIKKNGGIAYSYVCNISDRTEVYEKAEIVKTEIGKVSMLINNAGIVSGKSFLETPDALIQKTFEVNALAHFWTTKAFLPDMIEDKRGHIVTVSSLAGLLGCPFVVDYSASKFAAAGFDEALYLELQATGNTEIFTTLVCPYLINTGMFDGVTTKLLSMMEPNDVAEAIVSSVLCNEKYVLIPRYLRFLLPFKFLLPIKTNVTLVNSVFGADLAMSTFKGRNYNSLKE